MNLTADLAGQTVLVAGPPAAARRAVRRYRSAGATVRTLASPAALAPGLFDGVALVAAVDDGDPGWAALPAACRDRGVLLVVNASQALGARPLDVTSTPVDAVVSCGYKWLCGPYGTGFAWLHPDLLARLRPQQAYWLAMQAGRGLDRMRDTTVRDDLGARAHDVFCPAAFTTTLPWIASLELLLSAGVDAIERHDQQLVDLLVDGLRRDRYDLVSPAAGPARSTLVVLSRRDGRNEDRHRRLAGAGIDGAYREGNLRLSLHLFNDAGQVDRALEVLHAP
jgi:selenocysteine lyase/cysteine desulfurase